MTSIQIDKKTGFLKFSVNKYDLFFNEYSIPFDSCRVEITQHANSIKLMDKLLISFKSDIAFSQPELGEWNRETLDKILLTYKGDCK